MKGCAESSFFSGGCEVVRPSLGERCVWQKVLILGKQILDSALRVIQRYQENVVHPKGSLRTNAQTQDERYSSLQPGPSPPSPSLVRNQEDMLGVTTPQQRRIVIPAWGTEGTSLRALASDQVSKVNLTIVHVCAFGCTYVYTN